MVIAFVEDSTGTGTARDCEVTLPASVPDGDLLFAVSGHNGGTDSAITAPAGWDAEIAEFGQNTNSGTQVSRVDYRISSDDSGVTYDWTMTFLSVAAAVLEYSGVDTTTPFDVAPSTDTGTGTAPGITTVTDGCVLIFAIDARASATITDPTGWTLRSDVTVGTGSVAHIRVYELAQAAAGATGDVTAGLDTTTGASCLLMALRPAAGGTTPNHGSVTGSIAWAGQVSGSRTSSGAVSGGTSWAGSATGSRASSGSLSATVAWSGAVTGHAPTVAGHHGTAAGTISWSGAVVGGRESIGSPSGVISWAGAVTGHAPTVGEHHGSASGGISWTGSTSGSRTSSGSAAGTVRWSGAIVGHAPTVGGHHGAVAATVAWAGAVTGSRESSSALASTVAWAGAASGSTTRSGSVSATVAWSGAVTGDNRTHRDLTLTSTPLTARWASTPLAERWSSAPVAARWKSTPEET